MYPIQLAELEGNTVSLSSRKHTTSDLCYQLQIILYYTSYRSIGNLMTRNALVQPLRNEGPGYNKNVNNITEFASSVFIVKGSHLLLT